MLGLKNGLESALQASGQSLKTQIPEGSCPQLAVDLVEGGSLQQPCWRDDPVYEFISLETNCAWAL